MPRKRIFLIIQAVLCALAAGLLAAAALSLYFDGAAKQAQGDMFYYMYTREKVGERLRPILPLLIGSLGMTLGGLILGVRDENADRPTQDDKLLRDLSGIRDRAVHQTAGSRELSLRAVILSLAVVLIIAGILNGGLEEVLAKGAAICMECVGLG